MLPALAAVLLLSACAPAPRQTVESAPVETTTSAPVEPASPAPPPEPVPTHLPAEQAPRLEFKRLPVPEFEPAVLVVPSGEAKLPLIVAAHGAGDTPEAQCEVWSSLVRERAFVLCPRGVALRRGADAYFYRNHHELEREFVSALKAVEAALGPRLSGMPGLYTGYSQGATMGALMIAKHAAQFRRLVLIEGGFDVWSMARAREYKNHGGERVLLVCGTRHCRDRAQKSVDWLTKSGLGARLEYVEGGGHAYWGEVAERVLEQLDWVL